MKTDCIETTGEVTRLGYVRKWIGRKRYLVHVLAWEQENGPVPDGMELDHICRNRACCNVEHLRAVTHKENCRRQVSCKLNEEKAAQIRKLRADGLSLREIGAKFGVTKQSIWQVVHGRQWA